MEQTQRIRRMEEILREANRAVRQLDDAVERYEALRESIGELYDYYLGSDWRRDFEDDEAGRLPPYEELPRGVLSEDGVYDLMTEEREVLARMLELTAKFVRES